MQDASLTLDRGESITVHAAGARPRDDHAVSVSVGDDGTTHVSVSVAGDDGCFDAIQVEVKGRRVVRVAMPNAVAPSLIDYKAED
jgi:hypothetical protein